MVLENLERTEQQQVWQRVFQPPEQPQPELRGMLLTALELGEIYRHLLSHSGGQQKELLKRLLEGEQATAAALRGLGVLCGMTEEVLRPWSPTREPGRQLLQRCYHRTRRCLVDYMSRSAEPEHGAVYRCLADRAAEHCVLLAQLLGMR